MSNLIIFLSFLISAIPGIYLAFRKDFIIIKNKKFNNFFMRAIYTVPVTTLAVLVLCIFAFYPLSFIFPEIANTIENTFGTAVVLFFPAIVGILFLLFMHKFFLRNDMPPEYLPDFEKYELYVYMPDIKIDAGSSYGTKFSEPIVKKGSKELQKLKQVGELIIDFKSLAGKDIAYGHYGEIIVSEKALELFKDNNLTGFQEQAVRNWKDSKIKTGEKYFQLISTYSMPPVSAKTKIVKYFPTKLSFLFSTFVYIEDHILYYDKSISSISDFNTSFELFGDKGGDLYAPQNLWIVSNKVMRIMINDLNQHKRDFVPVILISEKGNEK